VIGSYRSLHRSLFCLLSSTVFLPPLIQSSQSVDYFQNLVSLWKNLPKKSSDEPYQMPWSRGMYLTQPPKDLTAAKRLYRNFNSAPFPFRGQATALRFLACSIFFRVSSSRNGGTSSMTLCDHAWDHKAISMGMGTFKVNAWGAGWRRMRGSL
jgi:hypothetical protein